MHARDVQQQMFELEEIAFVQSNNWDVLTLTPPAA